jgi:ABC-type antimicrobial peptide transport system permease subunit
VLAHWGVQALVAAAPANLAFQATSPVEIDGRVLGVSAVLILLTGFLFGIVPAIRGSRPNLEGHAARGGRAAGVFAVLSQLVSQRTREIGVRMALGARPADVLRLVLARGMRPATIGVVLGLAGAFWLSRFLEALLFEVEPTDPASFAAVTLLLAAVALAACWLPARAAMKVEPAVALRVE